MKKQLLFLMIFLLATQSWAQDTENVFIISLDGLRWQELFGGADSLLIDDSGYVENPEELVETYWHTDPIKRRAMLMPFMWSTIVNEGQLYGNRQYGNKVDCTNQMWFSYPGYNEILTGFADDTRITSNDKINNPNVTILEYLNMRKGYEGKVAAFGSWDVFPYIINRERSGLPINAGFETAEGNLTETEAFLNKIQGEIRGPWGGVRLDVFTHHYALEYVKKNKPKVLYVAYGETDDFAHDGDYDQYLKSATQTDAYIKELWDFAQSDPQYKDKTAMIITTDHGRGTNPKETWKHHGNRISDAGGIWIAMIGPDTPALGEVKISGQLYQNQVARTAMAALGEDYDEPKAGKAIVGALK
ncbi:MAG: sulfatase-like hydrolase/transferase [Cyclobacteriaceae bacterium]